MLLAEFNTAPAVAAQAVVQPCADIQTQRPSRSALAVRTAGVSGEGTKVLDMAAPSAERPQNRKNLLHCAIWRGK